MDVHHSWNNLPLAKTSYPVVKLRSIKVCNQNNDTRNGRSNNRCLVLAAPDTRSLYCKEIRPRHATKGREN